VAQPEDQPRAPQASRRRARLNDMSLVTPDVRAPAETRG
jgi:hypothetical protein